MKSESISESIKAIITLFSDAISDHNYSYEQVNILDKETQDILHSMELDNLSKNERNRVATRLTRVRKERRVHKDIVEATEPLTAFLESEKGRQMCNLLNEALGKTRKVERYHRDRHYNKRVNREGER